MTISWLRKLTVNINIGYMYLIFADIFLSTCLSVYMYVLFVDLYTHPNQDL